MGYQIHGSLYIAITYNKALRISFHFIMVCPRKLRVFQIFPTIHSIGIENSRSAQKASTSGCCSRLLLSFFSFFFFWHTKILASYRADSLLTHSLSIRRVYITHSMLIFFPSIYKVLDGWRRNSWWWLLYIQMRDFIPPEERRLWKSLKVIFFFGINHFRVFTAQDMPSEEGKIQCSKRRRNHFDSRETFFAS